MEKLATNAVKTVKHAQIPKHAQNVKKVSI